jgi:hypothetical protein
MNLNWLLDHVVAVDHSRADRLEPTEIHRGTFATRTGRTYGRSVGKVPGMKIKKDTITGVAGVD